MARKIGAGFTNPSDGQHAFMLALEQLKAVRDTMQDEVSDAYCRGMYAGEVGMKERSEIREKEAFEAGVRWEWDHWDYLVNTGSPENFINAGFAAYLANKKKGG